MALQTVNCYAFQVKRLSLMTQQVPQSSGAVGTGGGGYTPGVYLGDQVFVVAANPTNAMAVLAAIYGSDLGPVTGGASVVSGAQTTMTGS